jgi:hypothetical protein
MRLSVEDAGGRFVATCYRLMFRSPGLLHRLRHPEASITRTIRSERSQRHPLRDVPVAPVDPQTSVIHILSYSASQLLGNLVVSVCGPASDCHFAQQFVLRLDGPRYVVMSDSYCEFDPACPDLVNCSDDRPPKFALSSRDKRATADDLEPARSITLPNLSSSYKGDELLALYQRFGPVAKQCYTYKTVFIEYETVEARDAALSATPAPMYKGAYVRCEPGLRQPDQKKGRR